MSRKCRREKAVNVNLNCLPPMYTPGYCSSNVFTGWSVKMVYAIALLIVIILQFSKAPCPKGRVLSSDCLSNGGTDTMGNGLCDNSVLDSSVLFIFIVFLLVICSGCGWDGSGGFNGGWGCW